MPKSTFGPQAYAKDGGRFRSYPSYGFGASTREVAGKVFVSQEHTALATAGTQGPGPIYLLAPSVGGKQPDGRKPDPPVWKLGTAERFPKSSSSLNEPGPQKYTLPGLIGQKPTPGTSYRSEPIYGFGSATRDQCAKAMTEIPGTESPGPVYTLQGAMGKISSSRYGSGPLYSIAGRVWAPDGTGGEGAGLKYTLPQSIGPQPDSRMERAPTMLFGTSTREQNAKRFVSVEHKKNLFGTHSPGPAAPYQLDSSLGKQGSGRYKTQPNTVFSRASRWAKNEAEQKRNTVPGPGAYDF
jgi:hypothetical protein